MATVTPFPQFPRVVRAVPAPLALYLRPGRADQKSLLEFAATGDASAFHGAVFDASLQKSHRELLERTHALHQDAILDPRTQPLATAGGFTSSLGKLPWGGDRPHGLDNFRSTAGRRRINEIAAFATANGYTQVLAPTHILTGANDPWLAVDVENCRHLRDALDRRGGSNLPIIYSLAIPYSTLRNREQFAAVIEAVQRAPIASLWLAVEGIGCRSTATAALNFLDAAEELHRLGVPVVADSAGGLVGLSLLAFGAVGGISHGITFGEHRDTSHWRKPREKSDAFGLSRGVYFPAVDLMLKPDEAKALLETSQRAKALLGCSNPNCCPRGVTDMIQNPARHFLYRRTAQISELSRIPEQLRPQRFLDQHVRPATDLALAIANLQWSEKSLADRATRHRKRLDLLRVALGKRASATPPISFAQLPATRKTREGAR